MVGGRKQNLLHIIVDLCNFILCNILPTATGHKILSCEEYSLLAEREEVYTINMMSVMRGEISGFTQGRLLGI